tara:strand:- start:5338 stop:7539 length:2202 start_codon:yes stop_codon:yes gene_type:complete
MPLDSPILGDGDAGFRALVSRLRPSQLKEGDVAISRNMRFDEAGAAKVREGYKNVSGTLVTTTILPTLKATGDASQGALFLIGEVDITAMSLVNSTGLVTVTTAASWIGSDPGMKVLVNISGNFPGKTADPTGNRIATYVSANQFTFPLSGADEVFNVSDNEVVGSFKLTGGVNAIYGACRFSNPASNNDDYIIIANNESATAIKLDTLATTSIAYPAGVTVNDDAQLQQEFDVVMLRVDGQTSLQFDPDDGSTGLGGTPAFTKVSSGTYTQPVDLSASATVTTAGKVAMNVSSHGLESGDRVVVVDAASSGLTNGTEYRVTKTDADNFSFSADVKTAGSSTVVVRKKVSVAGGFVHPPAVAWGTYHQRRVWCPYTHDSAASPQRRSPAVYDELIASDLLDHNTFDPVQNQLKITAGTADFIVGAQPFDDDRLIVFNRNSIHQVRGCSGSLLDISTHMLTDEIGCTARKSIVTYANQVLFLSDAGVYSISFLDALNLRGTEQPLSEAIEPDIKRINSAYADRAVGIYHDNRYWLAVPTGNSTVNNEIFVYSFLNKGWESIDTTGAETWGVIDLIPARSGKINELYAVTDEGGVHKITRTGLAEDRLSISSGAATATVFSITSQLRTRAYTHGTIERKRFNHVEAHIASDSEHASDGDLKIVTEDPDETVDLGTLSGRLGAVLSRGEGASVRARAGNPRGFAAQIDWVPSAGRPELRAVALRATSTFNKPTSTT